MKWNFHNYSTLLLLILFLWSGCEKDTEVKVNDIHFENIDAEGVVLEVDQQVQVEVATFPENAARRGITYKSSDESIFTVSAKGVVFGHNVGEAELTVKTQDGSYLSDTRPIKVIPKTVPVESIEILGLEEDGYLILPFERRHRILLNLIPESANTAVTYHSSNIDIFTIDEKGYTMGLVVDGEAELTISSVRDPDISTSCKIKVLDLSIQEIILPDENISLKYLGDQYDLGEKITLVPAAASKERVVYSSSNQAVASISPDGIITAKGKGNVVITMTTTDGSDIEKTVDVEVEAELHYNGWNVTASSYNASQGTPGAILVDGATPFWHNKWEGGSEPLPHWLLIDMAEEKLITEVLVERRWSNTDVRKVIVEISRDGDTFTQVGIMDWGSVPATDFIRFVTFIKQNVRYIRLTITESNRAPFASINRVRVYGALE